MRKNFFKIILPILFIIGSKANYTQGQTSGDKLQCHQYCFDSVEIACIAKVILENEMLKENEILYTQKDSINLSERELLNGKIRRLQEVISLKEEQIKKFESIPRIMEKKGWTWWQYSLAAIGTVCAGFTAGVIYEASR